MKKLENHEYVFESVEQFETVDTLKYVFVIRH